jgi:hypothetical protein
MTIEQRWNDVCDRSEQHRGEPPAPDRTMPTLQEWALMWLITAVYWSLYHGWGPDACGEPGSEPRTTWENGGSFGEGHRAIWGL